MGCVLGNEPSEVPRYPVMIGLTDSAEIGFRVDKKSCEGFEQRGDVIQHTHRGIIVAEVWRI